MSAAGAIAWGVLEWSRRFAEHQAIPVFVVLQLPPRGPMASAMKAGGFTTVGTSVPYDQVTNPPVSVSDVAALKRCLARDQFLPLFPDEIEISGEGVEALYRAKVQRRTGGFHQTAVLFANENQRWRIVRIEERRGTVDPVKPWKWWERLLDFVPFVD